MWVDVYDFDGTIFRGDTTFVFWGFCLRSKPSLLKHLPRQLAALARMAANRADLARGKGEFLCFLRDIDVHEMAKAFWASPKTLRHVADWFDKRDVALPTVIASASPECLLAPLACKYGVQHLIGTQIDATTGALTGSNCKGTEKVARLQTLLPGVQIRAMYTDDVRADGPLLVLAQQKYLVRRGIVKRLW